jgi:hypothetical protein
MIVLTLLAPDVDEILAGLGAGSIIRVQSGAAVGGPFTNLTTVALVAGDTAYTYYDTAGIATTWYRTRYEDAVGTFPQSWTGSFLGVAPTTYATLEDFNATFDGSVPDSTSELSITSALEDATAQITAAVGWDFFRHPASTGTEARVFDGPGGDRLHLHSGLATSPTLVEIAWDTALTYTSLAAGDWYVSPSSPDTGEPYDHIYLAEGGSYPTFPTGQRRVRVTAAFGYSAVPTIVKRATVALARQLYRSEMTVPGGLAGPAEFEAAGLSRWWPESTYRMLRHYQMKFNCWT